MALTINQILNAKFNHMLFALYNPEMFDLIFQAKLYPDIRPFIQENVNIHVLISIWPFFPHVGQDEFRIV